MKKILGIFAFVAFALNAFPQGKTWTRVIDIGVIGQFRSTWLINKNISDAAGHEDYAATFGGGAGLRIQYFGGGPLGGGIELGYGTINQKYKGVNTSSYNIPDYESTNHLKCFDIPVFLKLGSSEGGYFEAGCQFSFITGATNETNLNHPPDTDPYYTGDVSDKFKSKFIAPFIGFGGSFNLIQEQVLLTVGLRFAYGVSDVVGIDGWGQDLTEGSATYTSVIRKAYKISYDNYQPTHPLYGGLMLGIIYSIPVS